MLRALELVGFKSFADKTRFEFPAGITVVVGPNGSGKSNIVDAVKWVLGEQSVKSLRGKEMADVIFNGSGGRRAMNSAQATLVFDNTTNMLPIDTEEVAITRRVYRNGEGEYLINHQPCRLRDIRDLFAGTGVATEAYSIIEQGKVDSMLQASPRDRRMIFEEAAGISRFKAKKLEALRRLERVDQNLVRLSDIVEEVENRLRTVKSQATKARRYRDYTARLQELRTQVGLSDWRHLSEQIDQHEQELAKITDESDQLSAQAESLEASSLAIEHEITGVDESIRGAEKQAAENREAIATREATVEHERTRSGELEEEIARHQQQLEGMTNRSRGLHSKLEDTTRDVELAESEYQRGLAEVEACEVAVAKLTEDLDHIRKTSEGRRAAHMNLLRQNSDLGNSINSLRARIEQSESDVAKAEEELGRLASQRTSLLQKSEELARQLERQERSQQQLEEQWAHRQIDLENQRNALDDEQRELADVRERYAVAGERAAILEELERRQEGISAGVKQVLALARGKSEGPYRLVKGLVADLFQVRIDAAPLIEVALGEKTGYLVIDSGEEQAALFENPEVNAVGRIGYIRLETSNASQAGSLPDYRAQVGVVGRADEFVEVSPEYRELVARMLGTTWIVEKREHALTLAATAPSWIQFVTSAGELVAGDGSVCLGPRHSATGLISRRSELRVLGEQTQAYEAKIADKQRRVETLQGELKELGATIERLATERQRTNSDVTRLGLQRTSAVEKVTQLDLRVTEVQAEQAITQSELHDTKASLEDSSSQRAKIVTSLSEMEASLRGDSEQVEAVEQSLQASQRDATAAKVSLAKREQSLEDLRNRMQQFQQDHQEREKAIEDTQSHLQSAIARKERSERTVLDTESQIAQLYLAKEQFAQEIVAHTQQRSAAEAKRFDLTEQAKSVRSRLKKLESQAHQAELGATEVRHERNSLHQRMREDYDIELDQVEQDAQDEAEQQERDQVEEEIAELRRKITNIGNVNLEALEELETLEDRFGGLAQQHQDLTEAKVALEKIIEKINVDSRRLFAETLDTVRGHFQTLFRKLFGGGQADIVIEDEEDILESGIEIVARPPGKEPRNISLLSGGEKTLTCVALLLAIFRSRPSPFCILDEVDAALDEANIERFIGVLKEFLAWTQFIVVTHSKKTMTCAGTLYGVTMQESGISKRVSVQFDDVSETGEILRTRDDEEAPDDTQAA